MFSEVVLLLYFYDRCSFNDLKEFFVCLLIGWSSNEKLFTFLNLTGCIFRFVTRIRDTPPSCSDSCGSNRNPRRNRSSCNHHIGVLSCHLCRLHIGSSLLSLSSLSPAHWQLVDHILDHLGPTVFEFQEVFNSILYAVVYIREVIKASMWTIKTQTAAWATVDPEVGANHCFLIIHHPIMGSHRSHTCTGGQNSFHIITRRKTVLLNFKYKFKYTQGVYDLG